MIRKVGILTSGGDTPGMNAVIRAVVRSGLHTGIQVMGVLHGYRGLMDGNMREMRSEDVENIVHKGGTILKTSRSEGFKTVEGREKAVQAMRAYDLDALITLGGNGTLTGARLLSKMGVNVIGLPGTIDNDLAYTDYTIGFDTAVNTVTNEIYKIRDTMRSHDRVGVVEVMGNLCGDIALHAGIASGADYVLVPELPYDIDVIAQKLMANRIRGKFTSIVVIAEGAGKAQNFVDYIRENTDVDIKGIKLGYVQRGGDPSAFDRTLAARMGDHAIELCKQEIFNRVVGVVDHRIVDIDIEEAMNMKPVFNQYLYDLVPRLAR